MATFDRPPDDPATGEPAPTGPRAARWGLALLAGLAAAAGLYVVFWLVMASQLREGVEGWAAARRAEGYAASWRRLELSGFPWRLRASLDAPRLGAPGARAPWGWEGERLVVETRPWRFDEVRVEAAGGHRIGLTVGGRRLDLDGRARALALDLGLAGGEPTAATLAVGGLAFAAPGEPRTLAVDSAAIKARRPRIDRPDYRTATFELAIEAAGLDLPLALPLGSAVAALALEASVMGGIAEGRLAAALAGWRDDGGVLEVGRFALDYGPLSLRASGTLALDAEMQPIAAFTAQVQGFFETVDALERAGLVKGRDAVAAKVVLGVLAKRSGEGGRPTWNLPVTVQDGKLYAGPVILAEMPAIAWPGAAGD